MIQQFYIGNKPIYSMILDGFISGLKKSFSFKHNTRKLNICMDCGEDSFFMKCLYCHTNDDYEKRKTK